MIIKVRKKHIKLGHAHSFEFCPVALAVLDAEFDDVSVSHWSINGNDLNDNNVRCHAVTPRSVRRFINRFDKGKKVKPFNFRFQAMPADFSFDDETEAGI